MTPGTWPLAYASGVVAASVMTGSVGCDALVAVMVWLVLLVWPPPPVTASVTVKLLALLNVCDGFWVVPVEPSPKLQFHEAGLPVDWSVNCTVNGACAL